METIGTRYEKEKTMTLFKQLTLAISLIIIIILASVLAINYNSSKAQMIESTYQTTVNNISTLSQQLSDAANDEALITSIIDAAYSSGYYEVISYKSFDSDFSYAQFSRTKPEGVPQWFITLTDLELKTVKNEVTSGWSMLGELKVKGDSEVLYQSLYKIFIKLVVLFIIVISIASIVLHFMLHFILKPLKKIQTQAEAIMKNEFIIEQSTPFTTEFQEVSSAMNSMVKKVEEIFNQANETSKKNHQLLYQDHVTQLVNRRYLLLKLSETVQLETKVNGGSLLIISLSGAEVLNKRFNRNGADKIFYSLGQIFYQQGNSYDDSIVARLNGSEFCLVLPGCDLAGAHKTADAIYAHFIELLKQYALSLDEVALHIGGYKYRANIDPIELLKAGDDNLLQAKANEHNVIFIDEDPHQDKKTKEEFRAIIHDALENDKIKLKFWNSTDASKHEVDHKVTTFMIEDGDQPYYYGDFIAVAIELGLSSQMYIHVLEKIFTSQLEANFSNRYSIRLANQFLKDSSTFNYLENLFKKYTKNSQHQFIFEVSNSFCTQNTALAIAYAQLFKKFNFELCINAFVNEASDLNYLKSLSPSMIKADASFLLDLSSESLQSLLLITNSLDIKLIATMVKNEYELQTLQGYRIHTIQGPLTDKL